MSRSSKLCGVILAAGESTRMGTDKALLPWPPAPRAQPSGGTFLSAAIQSLSRFSEMVIVVAGKNEENLAPVVYAQGGFLIRNPEPERGQFSSLQAGLQEVLNRGRDAAMVTLVDRPPAADATLRTLCEHFVAASHDTWAIIPEYQGKHGHPFLAARELIGAFLKAPATARARDIEHLNQQHVHYVAVDDPAVILNVDTPQEYANL